MAEPEPHILAPGNGLPNSPLPLLFYNQALAEGERTPAGCQALFRGNGWHGLWLNGVFSYWHYHAGGHEVLGCVGGSARVGFGGEQGIEVEFQRGDAVLIPAGVGHKRVSSTPDFLVVGGYPPGQDGAILAAGQMDQEAAEEAVAKVALPQSDPILGSGGLRHLWV